MKEIELNIKDKTEISVKQKKQVEKQLVGDIIPHNGHTIWKINNETLEIEKAKYINTAYIVGGENKKEILVIDGFTYISALKKDTALKKFHKGENGGKNIDRDPLKL